MKPPNGRLVLVPPPTVVDENGVEVCRADSDLTPTRPIPVERHPYSVCPRNLRPHDPKARCVCKRTGDAR